MISYCVEHTLFSAYVRLRMAAGTLLDEHTEVYGAGTHRVGNPEDLFYGHGRVKLFLHGDVFYTPDAADVKYKGVEWEYTSETSKLRILFKRSELDELKALASTENLATTEAAAVPNTHLIVISKLLEMLKGKGSPRYTQDSIVKAIEDDCGYILGMGATNLRTLFADANKERKNAPPPPPSGSSRIRLDSK